VNYQKAYEMNSMMGNKSGTLYNLKGLGALYLKIVTDAEEPSSPGKDLSPP
jgi:hypothetical protein